MKKTTLLSLTLILAAGLLSSAQIGVNTNSPTANLDVNGTLRVRSLEKAPNGSFQANGNVLYMMGVDANGNVIPIEIGENIVLINNKLQVQLPEEEPVITELPNGGTLEGNYSDNNDALINDLDLGIVILPGDRRGHRPVVRLSNGDNDEKVTISGIKALEDGTMAYLYATSGEVELKTEDSESLEENQFESDGNFKIKKNEMLLVMYDGEIKKWVIVSRH